jgi:hypothetical protein
VERRRRLKIIPNAFGERAVPKMMFGAVIRAAERWCSVKVSDFERRQLAAVRKELDQEYEAMPASTQSPSKDGNLARKSSSSLTHRTQRAAKRLALTTATAQRTRGRSSDLCRVFSTSEM